MDSAGELHERVYDVVVSDGRRIGSNGRCEQAVGNTVDIRNATYENSIGDAVQMGYWKDPDFDASEHAFYYVRVLEIPTPRWIVYDAKYYGFEVDEDMFPLTQERAYTSPIWYTP
jgi:hypothetical protein